MDHHRGLWQALFQTRTPTGAAGVKRLSNSNDKPADGAAPAEATGMGAENKLLAGLVRTAELSTRDSVSFAETHAMGCTHLCHQQMLSGAGGDCTTLHIPPELVGTAPHYTYRQSWWGLHHTTHTARAGGDCTTLHIPPELLAALPASSHKIKPALQLLDGRCVTKATCGGMTPIWGPAGGAQVCRPGTPGCAVGRAPPLEHAAPGGVLPAGRHGADPLPAGVPAHGPAEGGRRQPVAGAGFRSGFRVYSLGLSAHGPPEGRRRQAVAGAPRAGHAPCCPS